MKIPIESDEDGLSESEIGSLRKAVRRQKRNVKKSPIQKKKNVKLVVPRKGRTKIPKVNASLDNDNPFEGAMHAYTLNGNLRGVAKNCSYDINMLYSSLQRSKIWAVRGHKDFVYIFSKQDTQGREAVSTIPLSPKSVSTAKIAPLMSNDSFSAGFKDEENTKHTRLDLGSMSAEEKMNLISQKHLFVFSFGALIVWGGSKGTIRTMEKMLRPFESDEIDLSSEEYKNERKDLNEMTPLMKQSTSRLCKSEIKNRLKSQPNDPYTQFDDMEFRYDVISRLRNDVVSLQSDNVEEKIAVSFAFAQSLKLTIFEEYVDSTFDKSSKYSRCLSSTGRILDLLSQKEVSKAVGELFTVRTEINMNAGILDTPDFFWDNDEFEPLYVTSRKYLDVPKRLDVLTKKLSVIGDLLEVLQTQLENEHGNRLEWVIIVLIAIEVFIQVVWNIIIKDILKFFPDSVEYASHH